jgi:two-component sensor histidine kinase
VKRATPSATTTAVPGSRGVSLPRSVRTRLIAIIAAALIPGGLFAVLTGYSLTRTARQLAYGETVRAVDAAAGRYRLALQGALQMLRTIALSDAVIEADHTALNRYLADLMAENRQYATILATDDRGLVIASGLPVDPYILADRAYIQEAIRTHRPAIGGYMISRSTGLPIVPLALPVLAANGRLRCILVAALRASALAEAAAAGDLAAGGFREVLDRDRQRIVHTGSAGAPSIVAGADAGGAAAGAAFAVAEAAANAGGGVLPLGLRLDPRLEAMLDAPQELPAARLDLDGRAYLVASADVVITGLDEPALEILLGLPLSARGWVARGTVPYFAAIALLSPLITALLAALLYDRLIGRRLDRVFAAAAAVGPLEEAPPAPPTAGEDELGYLERILGEAAAALGRREAERHASAQALRASLKEKDVLLKEIHHRVKNNIQVISSMLSLQSMSVKDEAVLRMFDESRGRIQSMAMIHDRACRSEDFSSIDFGEYSVALAEQVAAFYRTDADRIELALRSGLAPLAMDTALPLGLILNELLTNCYKHAFPSGRSGRISVGLAATDRGRAELSVEDDGIGVPAGFAPEKATTLGLELVSALAKQLRGALAVQSPPRGKPSGVRFAVGFPIDPDLNWTDAARDVIIKA